MGASVLATPITIAQGGWVLAIIIGLIIPSLVIYATLVMINLNLLVVRQNCGRKNQQTTIKVLRCCERINITGCCFLGETILNYTVMG